MNNEPRPPSSFDEVYEAEWMEIRERRAKHGYDAERPGDDTDASPQTPRDLVGLALSGGGIRSATFCLGFLQQIHKQKLLRIFDYLSTVSGGGYVGGWWSAWLSREEDIVPLRAEDIEKPDVLITKVRAAQDEISTNLRNHLCPETIKLLDRYRTGGPEQDRDKLTKGIVEALNKAVSELSLKEYSEPSPKENSELSPKKYADWIGGLASDKASLPKMHTEIFPPEEKIESDRKLKETGGTGKPGAEGSSSAWTDPIHHLRLFASYLTPRRGALSADTWRAVSVLTRNLVLTWLVLLPILLVIVLVGQLYFELAPGIVKWFLGATSYQNFIAGLPVSERFIYLVVPVALFLSLIAVLAVAWLVTSPERLTLNGVITHLVCLGGVISLITIGLDSYLKSSGMTSVFSQVIGRIGWLWLFTVACLLLGVLFWPTGVKDTPRKSELAREWRKQIRRNRLSRIHTKLMTWMVLSFIILLISGYGYSFVQAMPGISSPSPKILLALLPVLTALAGSIFTALKASPAGGAETRRSREPSLFSRIVFTVTPVLLVLLLAIGAAWLGESMLIWGKSVNAAGVSNYLQIRPVVTVAIIFGLLLCFALAVYEMEWFRPTLSLSLSIFICLAVFSFYWAAKETVTFIDHHKLEFLGFFRIGDNYQVLLIPLIGAAVIPFIFLCRELGNGRWKNGLKQLRKSTKDRQQLRGVFLLLLPMLFFILLAAAAFILYRMYRKEWNLAEKIYPMMTIVAALAGSMILFRMFVVRKDKETSDFKLKPRWKRSKAEKEVDNLWWLASACLVIPVVLGYLLCSPIREQSVDKVLVAFIFFVIPLAALPFLLIYLRSLAVAYVGVNPAPPKGHEIKQGGRRAKRNKVTALLAKVWGWVSIDGGSENDSSKGSHYATRMFVCVIVGGMLTLGYGVTAFNASSEARLSMVSPTAAAAPAVIIALIFAVILGLVLFGLSTSRAAGGQFEIPGDLASKPDKISIWGFSILCIAAAVSVGYLSNLILTHISGALSGDSDGSQLAKLALAGLLACFTITAFEVWWGRGDNRRSLWLLTCNYVTLSMLFIVGLSSEKIDRPDPSFTGLFVMLGLLAIALVWVVALGWMVDPNMVSMHQFYKGRLVRAYLGASNSRRFHQNKDIAESVAGDDVHLKVLRNCQRGAPYHLINTTLNLVGGRDLATAQRSASSFILSKKYCGSPRTSYRPTHGYMNGQLTLGTAVAASGAAVSPSMGAKKPTAALAMLMTLLNVRLGFWAPTPDKDKWDKAQPRLWPFYLLREFMSQTNDLASYCHLTDGGHFDNTGLYSLVERGCHFIVMVDCAADPKPCFQDLGDAVRRCRIDFGTEIDLNIEPLMKTNEEGAAESDPRCFVVGTISYSRRHIDMLGLDESEQRDDKKALSGIIIYIKPSIMGKEITADVRQYAIENAHFPQQTTANQWFDEAQFESYRRLGQLCAEQAFGELKAVEEIKAKDELLSADIKEIFREADRKFNPKGEVPGGLRTYM